MVVKFLITLSIMVTTGQVSPQLRSLITKPVVLTVETKSNKVNISMLDSSSTTKFRHAVKHSKALSLQCRNFYAQTPHSRRSS